MCQVTLSEAGSVPTRVHLQALRRHEGRRTRGVPYPGAKREKIAARSASAQRATGGRTGNGHDPGARRRTVIENVHAQGASERRTENDHGQGVLEELKWFDFSGMFFHSCRLTLLSLLVASLSTPNTEYAVHCFCDAWIGRRVGRVTYENIAQAVETVQISTVEETLKTSVEI